MGGHGLRDRDLTGGLGGSSKRLRCIGIHGPSDMTVIGSGDAELCHELLFFG